MKSVVVSVWLDGSDDSDFANISYVKTYKGDDCIAHERFVRNAQKKFPNWSRINVERV